MSRLIGKSAEVNTFRVIFRHHRSHLRVPSIF